MNMQSLVKCLCTGISVNALSLYTAPSVEAITVLRINQTAYRISTELLYTGGGDIINFTVSFRISGQVEWSTATTILAEVVLNSSNLHWAGVTVSSEFAVYSMVEFRVQATNEAGRTTSETVINELQGELMVM